MPNSELYINTTFGWSVSLINMSHVSSSLNIVNSGNIQTDVFVGSVVCNSTGTVFVGGYEWNKEIIKDFSLSKYPCM